MIKIPKNFLQYLLSIKVATKVPATDKIMSDAQRIKKNIMVSCGIDVGGVSGKINVCIAKNIIIKQIATLKNAVQKRN